MSSGEEVWKVSEFWHIGTITKHEDRTRMGVFHRTGKRVHREFSGISLGLVPIENVLEGTQLQARG